MTINDVKQKMVDIDAFYGDEEHTWYQGYISALVNNALITEDQFNELMDWDCQTI